MKRSGFTVVEMLVAFSILIIAFTLWSGSLSQLLNLSNLGKDKFNLAMEQKSMVTLLEALSKNAALQALCVNANGDQIPHPYGRLKGDGTCEELKTPTPAELSDWLNLSKKVTTWPSVNTDADLDPNYFASDVVPALTTAGCMHCHGGGQPKAYALPPGFSNVLSAANMNNTFPEVASRDFGSFNDLTQPVTYNLGGNVFTSESFASKAILTLKLGQALLAKQMHLGQLLSSDSRVEHYIAFDKKSVAYSVPNYEQLSKTVTGKCAAINAAAACNAAAGEIYDPVSCQDYCTSYSSPPVCSCGKGCFQICPGWVPVCQSWDAQYICLTKEKLEIKTLFNIVGNLGGVPPLNPPTWQNRPDNFCLTQLPVGPQCDGVVCGMGNSSSCLETGTCRHFCTSVQWSAPIVCGKGCFIPPAPIGCNQKKVEFQCRRAVSMGQTHSQVINFSINSVLLDSNGNVQKSITSAGAIR